MSEFMLINGAGGPRGPLEPSSDDPVAILLRMTACLRDLDRIEARLAAAYLETAIHHLRSTFDPDGNCSGTD